MKKQKKKKKNTEEVVKEDALLEPVAFCGSTFFLATARSPSRGGGAKT